MPTKTPKWLKRKRVTSWRVRPKLFDEKDRLNSREKRFEGLHSLCRPHLKNLLSHMSTSDIRALSLSEMRDFNMILAHHKDYDSHDDKLYNALTRYARKHGLNN